MVVRWENNILTQPEEAACLKVTGGFEPHISLDGSRIYFTRFAPPPSGLADDKNLSPQDMEAQMVNIWVIEKLKSGWGDPKFCVNGMYVTTSNSGAIYTTDIRRVSEGICRYRLVNGKYSDREHLQGGVNSPSPGAHPCIPPDESYIIFDSKRSTKLTGELLTYKGNTFIARWNDRSMDADAWVMFNLDNTGKASGIKMKAISPLTDFSYDFQDLDFNR